MLHILPNDSDSRNIQILTKYPHNFSRDFLNKYIFKKMDDIDSVVIQRVKDGQNWFDNTGKTDRLKHKVFHHWFINEGYIKLGIENKWISPIGGCSLCCPSNQKLVWPFIIGCLSGGCEIMLKVTWQITQNEWTVQSGGTNWPMLKQIWHAHPEYKIFMLFYQNVFFS